ncbi:MAG TPA: hypothetical protein VID04_15575 [Methylomirabilota bacterium]
MSEGVTGLVVVFAIAIGPTALVLALLNARDTRRDRVISIVLGAFDRRLSSAVALEVRAPLLSRRTVAVLDMSDYGSEVWPTMRRLATVLPPHVALVVLTRVDGALPVTVTLRRPAALPA